MDTKSGPTRKSDTVVKSTSSLEIKADSNKTGKGSDKGGARGSWIREDGAICFDNECITLKPNEDGELALTYDPSKCSCEESNSAILDALTDCVMSGKGINLIVKPRVETPKKSVV